VLILAESTLIGIVEQTSPDGTHDYAHDLSEIMKTGGAIWGDGLV